MSVLDKCNEILARMAEFKRTKQVVDSTNSLIDSNNKAIASLIESLKNRSNVSTSVQYKVADKKEPYTSHSEESDLCVMPKCNQESNLLENTQNKRLTSNLYFRVDVSQNQSSNKEFDNIGVSEPEAVTLQPAQVTIDRSNKIQEPEQEPEPESAQPIASGNDNVNFKITNVTRVKSPESRVQESKSPSVQESKSPESKSPRVQSPESRVQDFKSPRVQSPRVQESMCYKS